MLNNAKKTTIAAGIISFSMNFDFDAENVFKLSWVRRSFIFDKLQWVRWNLYHFVHCSLKIGRRVFIDHYSAQFELIPDNQKISYRNKFTLNFHHRRGDQIISTPTSIKTYFGDYRSSNLPKILQIVIVRNDSDEWSRLRLIQIIDWSEMSRERLRVRRGFN